MKEIKNTQDFKHLMKQRKLVLLDFYAHWCGPCQTMSPILKKLEADYRNEIVMAKVNVDKNARLTQQFNVRSIPTLFFIKKGRIVGKLAGLQTKATLSAKIKKLA